MATGKGIQQHPAESIHWQLREEGARAKVTATRGLICLPTVSVPAPVPGQPRRPTFVTRPETTDLQPTKIC